VRYLNKLELLYLDTPAPSWGTSLELTYSQILLLKLFEIFLIKFKQFLNFGNISCVLNFQFLNTLSITLFIKLQQVLLSTR